MKIAFCICGSFCNFKSVYDVLKDLSAQHDITPIITPYAYKTDTRFGKSEAFNESVASLCKRPLITELTEAEATITNGGFDCVLVCPCTGNTLAKLSNGLNDNAVTMAVKCQIRNNRPVVIALATNDALSSSLENIARLRNRKNFSFVPLLRDNPEKKPNSMVCCFEEVAKCIEEIADTLL